MIWVEVVFAEAVPGHQVTHLTRWAERATSKCMVECEIELMVLEGKTGPTNDTQ